LYDYNLFITQYLLISIIINLFPYKFDAKLYKNKFLTVFKVICMNTKKIAFILIATILIISISGCKTIEELINDEPEELPSEEFVEEEPEVVEEVPEELLVEGIEEEQVPVGCSTKDDCEWDQYCIDGTCGKMTEIYDTESECEEKCNFDNVMISTSDGDELDLPRGMGSYTAAGAIEWKLMSSADYCKGEEDTVVAVKLTFKNIGVVLSEQIVTLEVGEVSDVISHPLDPDRPFTLTIDSINEECS